MKWNARPRLVEAMCHRGHGSAAANGVAVRGAVGHGGRMEMSTVAKVGLEAALKMGPPPPGNLAVPVFSRGSLAVELYTPAGHDPQQPHTRDEAYFVARGRGVFFDGARRHSVEPGAFLFVAAGREHRFEDFSDDFAVWVVFYGPEGGEAGS